MSDVKRYHVLHISFKKHSLSGSGTRCRHIDDKKRYIVDLDPQFLNRRNEKVRIVLSSKDRGENPCNRFSANNRTIM